VFLITAMYLRETKIGPMDSRLRRVAFAMVTLAMLGCQSEGLTLPPGGSGQPPGTGSGGGDPGGTDGPSGGGNPGAPAAPAPRAGSMQLFEGDSQTVAAGADVPVPPSVRVLDSLGNPVAGYPVTYVVTGGGGTLLNPDQTTGPDGVARAGRWTLGLPGRNTVEARAEALSGSPVVFEATALSRQNVDHFVFVRQPDGVRVNDAQEIQVAMVDAAGNVVPLSGIELYLGLFHREGEEYVVRNKLLLGERFSDAKDGIATFRLAVSQPGTYEFRVLSDELPELGPHGPEPYVFSNTFNVY
jgi:hypothetical protein